MEECKQREQKTGDALSGITDQFGYRYPYASESGRKLKFTVSELKKQIYFMEKEEALGEDAEALYEEPEVVPLIPQFLKKEEKLTGALRGTAYHRLMELLNFADDYDGPKLSESIRQIHRGRTDDTGNERLYSDKGYSYVFILRFRASDERSGKERKALEGTTLCAGRGCVGRLSR